MDTRLSSAAGGNLNMLALTLAPKYGVKTVELYFMGEPVGLFMDYGGLSLNMQVWNLFITVGGGAAPGTYPLELMATNRLGTEGLLWPYLNVTE